MDAFFYWLRSERCLEAERDFAKKMEPKPAQVTIRANGLTSVLNLTSSYDRCLGCHRGGNSFQTCGVFGCKVDVDGEGAWLRTLECRSAEIPQQCCGDRGRNVLTTMGSTVITCSDTSCTKECPYYMVQETGIVRCGLAEHLLVPNGYGGCWRSSRCLDFEKAYEECMVSEERLNKVKAPSQVERRHTIDDKGAAWGIAASPTECASCPHLQSEAGGFRCKAFPRNLLCVKDGKALRRLECKAGEKRFNELEERYAQSEAVTDRSTLNADGLVCRIACGAKHCLDCRKLEFARTGGYARCKLFVGALASDPSNEFYLRHTDCLAGEEKLRLDGEKLTAEAALEELLTAPPQLCHKGCRHQRTHKGHHICVAFGKVLDDGLTGTPPRSCDICNNLVAQQNKANHAETVRMEVLTAEYHKELRIAVEAALENATNDFKKRYGIKG